MKEAAECAVEDERADEGGEEGDDNNGNNSSRLFEKNGHNLINKYRSFWFNDQ